ncbi:MAG: nicotinamide-nucleotide adenylyltransferase [Nitrososphaerota archaeon]|nr:nicotinamide-nucleotide adenylyltransferase [Candidatus Calditenuaceae archaeon]MDW8072840.1 nicotinamide-nucleotide adenylyltransferase [Nitrososphaerota archaeon]
MLARWVGLDLTSKGVVRAVLIGRFQPFHMGHLSAVKEILQGFDEAIIAIGSSQFSHTFDNPFTAGERIEMIRLALKEDGQDLARIITVTVPDIGEHRLWVARLVAMCPRFDVAYSNNPFVRLLLEEQGIATRGAELYNREMLNATRIRMLMAEGGDWKRYVPKSVADYIDGLGGVERVRIAKSSATSALFR